MDLAVDVKPDVFNVKATRAARAVGRGVFDGFEVGTYTGANAHPVVFIDLDLGSAERRDGQDRDDGERNTAPRVRK